MNNTIRLCKKSIHGAFLLLWVLISYTTLDCTQLSLDQIYALSQEKKSTQLPTRSRSITSARKTTDLYTQSQAHMSVPAIKKLIAATYDTKPYEKLIKQVLDREKQYDDYYVFYHGTDNVWRLAQDLYTRLYANSKKISSQTMQDFIFLRFNEGLNDIAVNDFLINKLFYKYLFQKTWLIQLGIWLGLEEFPRISHSCTRYCAAYKIKNLKKQHQRSIIIQNYLSKNRKNSLYLEI